MSELHSAPFSTTALYTSAQIRQVEQAAGPGLMERAGRAAADTALSLLEPGAPVLVLAGPGNNGGDAFEVAAHLAHAGHPVRVMQFGEDAGYGADAQQALQRARTSGAHFATASAWIDSPWGLVIDGLFGIGLTRPLTDAFRAAAEAVNRLSCPVLALDIPSGLDADTGRLVGPDPLAIVATHTITFIGDKPGLHTASGRDHAGSVEVAALGIDPALFPPSHAAISGPAMFAHYLQPRRHDSHKGSYGDLTLAGGAHGMTGALLLSARAALFSGAGRVYAGFIDEAPTHDSLHPELMCRRAADLVLGDAAMVAGPGMGDSPAARTQLEKMIASAAPLLLDADALNLVAADETLQQAVAARTSPTLLTPHPLEAARLLGRTSGAVQADRLLAARSLAARFKAVVVLKGSGSVIARPDGNCAINPTGNAGLATAGSGDVLSGVAGALMAQGWPAWEAAVGSVWMHGRAAEMLVDRGSGPTGLTAGELIPAIREVLNQKSRL